MYSAMMFSDKIKLVRAAQVFDSDTDAVAARLGKIEQLIRHPIAHGNEFAMSSEHAVKVAATARSLRELIDRLKGRHLQREVSRSS